MKSYLKTLLVGFIIMIPSISNAQLVTPQPGNTNLRDLSFGRGIPGLLGTFVNILLSLAGIIAVLFVIIGGYQYLFSGANEDLAEKGKKTITNAVIGIVIIILSYTVVRVLFDFLTTR